MNGKEVLKPNLMKIVLAIILFIVIIFIPIVPSTGCMIKDPNVCDTNFSSLISNIDITIPAHQQASTLFLFAGIFVLVYLLSCGVNYWYRTRK